MTVITRELHYDTRGNTHVVDITSDVARAVAESGLTEGIVTVFVPHSTCGLSTMEYEPGCVEDLQRLFARLIPEEIPYAHNRRWGDDNGHAHLRATLLGPSLTVPFSQGRLLLGTWQQIILVDFDVRPRRRRVVLQILGEGEA